MSAAGLLNHLWQSTLVAGLAWLVTLALRRERATVRYGVWLAASLKFLIPFSVLTNLGERFGWRPIIVASFTPHEVFVDGRGGVLAERAIRIAAHQGVASSAVPSMMNIVPDLLFGIWMLVTAALLCTWFARWRRISGIVRHSTPLRDGPVVDALRSLQPVWRGRSIRVVNSPSAFEPGVFGVIRPTLLWPSRLSEHLSAGQIESILAHELTHVRRLDNLTAFVHLVAQALFWFHPMVWWIGTRLIDERERACDEAVLDYGSERESYAEGILTTCRLFTESPLTCMSGVTGSDLKKRIEHIMQNDVRSGLKVWKKSLLAAAGCAAMTLPFVVGVMSVRPLLAQQPATGAAFDVTSVKPNNSGSGMISMMPAANGGMQATNVTLGFLVRTAYRLQDSQIVGGPSWLFEDRFDVVGSGSAPGKDGPPLEKFKSLLADRFHLVTHVETRELPIYALVLARADEKLGDKLTRSTVDCAAEAATGRGRGQPPPPPAPGETPRCGIGLGLGMLTMGGQPMTAVAQQLSRLVGRIVVDKTGLAGAYNLTLTYAPDPGLGGRGDLPPQLNGAPPPPAITDRPSIFAAVQEQLGLRLESTKGPVDVLVIDSAEKPTQD